MNGKKEVKKQGTINNLWAGTNAPDANFLLQVVKLPVVVIVLIEIILIIFTDRYWQAVYWWLDYNAYIIIGLKILTALWTAWLLLAAIQKKINLIAPSYIAGALAGFLAGLLMAIFKIFWYHKFWTALNLVAEPLTMALLGALLVRIFVILLSKFLKNK